MCQICVAAVKEYWPDLPESEYGNLLMSATCFPCGPPETTIVQVREMADKVRVAGRPGDVQMALCIADEETEAAMSEVISWK
ncbi:hypothetical protein KAR91_46085 [Candidatus Pacearchaeota archaeon]|nr:hypothetical protein [Candidatus Pacearchaeota archaeon]